MSPAKAGADPSGGRPGGKGRRAREWAINLGLALLVVLAFQWWKGLPLARGPAPPLQGIDLTGQTIDLANDAGEPVLVHFWAVWCPMCKLGEGSIEAIARDHTVITVALQSGTPDDIRAHLKDGGRTFTTIPDPDGTLAARWGVAGVPTSFVVDREGQIRFATVGLSSGPGLRARLWAARHLPSGASPD